MPAWNPKFKEERDISMLSTHVYVNQIIYFKYVCLFIWVIMVSVFEYAAEWLIDNGHLINLPGQIAENRNAQSEYIWISLQLYVKWAAHIHKFWCFWQRDYFPMEIIWDLLKSVTLK